MSRLPMFTEALSRDYYPDPLDFVVYLTVEDAARGTGLCFQRSSRLFEEVLQRYTPRSIRRALTNLSRAGLLLSLSRGPNSRILVPFTTRESLARTLRDPILYNKVIVAMNGGLEKSRLKELYQALRAHVNTMKKQHTKIVKLYQSEA